MMQNMAVAMSDKIPLLSSSSGQRELLLDAWMNWSGVSGSPGKDYALAVCIM